MENLKNETLVNYSSQVYTTKDYFLFKQIDGNRNKNLLHINRLKKSMSEKYLFTVIIVNENYEIIDGQHRFEVIKELNLPLHYVVCDGYGLNDVHLLNRNAKKWNTEDYLAGYCDLGNENYIKYKKYKEKYNLQHHVCMTLLLGGDSKKAIDLFNSGEFKIKDYNNSCYIIEKILKIEPFYNGVRRRSFINTMSQLFKNKNFNFDEFMQKLKIQPTSLVDCVNSAQYIVLIEEIYNFRRRDKINLRY